MARMTGRIKIDAQTGLSASKGIAINRNSIGYIWINGVRYGYNLHLTNVNTYNFEQQNPNKIGVAIKRS